MYDLHWPGNLEAFAFHLQFSGECRYETIIPKKRKLFCRCLKNEVEMGCLLRGIL